MFIEHQSSCLIQSKPFLILQGAHCGELAEVVVEGWRTHLDTGCKVVDAKGRGVIQLQPIDGFRDPITLTIDRSYLSKPARLITFQETVVNFTLDQGGENRNGFRLIKQRQ